MLLLGVSQTSSCHSCIIASCLCDMLLSEILTAGNMRFIHTALFSLCVILDILCSILHQNIYF